MESHIAPTIAYYTKAKDMWSFLKKTYSHATNVIKILQVEEELYKIQQEYSVAKGQILTSSDLPD
ncbi:hypothetical protein EJ110_NYTH50672 [Nymphaea thermarum]|nr:hypothetical protein EJ110_NYTH50672 [Nymphaea thermarum]